MIRHLSFLIIFSLTGLGGYSQFPPELLCTRNDNGDVFIKWDVSVAGCTQFIIWKRTGSSGSFMPYDTLSISSADTVDANAVSGNTVYYYLQCLGGGPVTDTFDTDEPLPPEILYVTVLENQNVQIVWEPGESPETAGYEILQPIQGGYSQEGTVNGRFTTSTIHTGSDPGQQSEAYSLWSISNCAQEFSVPASHHKTIFLQHQINECERTVEFNWTAYEGWSGDIQEHAVLLSTNGGSYQFEAQNLSGGTLTYTYENIQNGDSLCFKIVAYNPGGDSSISNKICFKLDLTSVVDSVTLFNASVVPGKRQVDLMWEFEDPGADVSEFLIKRGRAKGSLTTIGSTGDTRYSDKTAIVDKAFYYYQIVSVDQCGLEKESNIGNTIHLNAKSEERYLNTLEWNSYELNLNEDIEYIIYRKVDDQPVDSIGIVDASTLNFEDDISDLYNAEGVFLYYIAADYTIPGLSNNRDAFSNVDTVNPKPVMKIPNAFSPTATNNKNRVFKPVLNFENPQTFKMLIFNRWGEIIKEINDPDQGWDGFCGSNICPAGTYVYQISFTGTDGETKELRRGTVTLLQ